MSLLSKKKKPKNAQLINGTFCYLLLNEECLQGHN